MSDTEPTHTDSHDEHGHGPRASSWKLATVAAINLLGFIIELSGGLLFGSVALLSDAFHMLFDALAYVMAFVATYIADRYGGSDRWSYGLHRLEPFAAFLNGLLLLPMIAFILWESYQRFLNPIEIGTGPTLAIAAGGLLINVGSVYVLHGDEMSLNERGAFYHLLGDAGGSIAVITSTAIIEVTGVRIIDPLTAGLITVLVAWSAIDLFRGSGAIFFHRAPPNADEIRSAIRGIDGVWQVTDFHAWRICSQITIVTAHVEAATETIDAVTAVTHRIHNELDQHGVDHATVEVHPKGHDHDVQLDTHSH